MQADLGIPKDQVELLKSFNTEDRNELVTNMLANYSFAIEINTSLDKTTVNSDDLMFDNEGGWEAFYIGDDKYLTSTYTPEFYGDEGSTTYYKNKQIITEKEYIKAREDKFTNKIKTPSKYYSNLTVPGGTNYTENEIATPAITPSIKGHAQFATDKGIGWFRADDSVVGIQNRKALPQEIEEIRDTEGAQAAKELEKNGIPDTGGDVTKTRRILEVQSDLFQKGRGKEILTGKYEEARLVKGYPQYNLQKETKENQFLQLLNQGSNWVTFFVKSIIQDSAKKGYEKVLFPSGNTASKVEGHTTLEEFKKQKEDRINQLENKKYESFPLKNGKFTDRSGLKTYETAEEANALSIKQDLNEINQLKQELERVEGPEGFGALKPIYNFYENTVTNVLNKQYGKENVKQVTDEYGNTWNEIDIVPEREQQPILLQKKGTETSTASPATIAMLKDFTKRIGVDIKPMQQIVVNGVRQDANGAALIMQKLIQVVEGKEASALPEEAMHFAVEIIKQTNPALYT
jgi:hypothetical protein